jgi:chromosome partitioning protein
MGQLVAIISQKGGVGKTSTAVNLGACISAMKRRVLLVGLDPQCGITKCFGMENDNAGLGLLDVMSEGLPIQTAIFPVHSRLPRLFAVPSNVASIGQESDFREIPNKDPGAFSRLFEPIRDEFDYIFFDCPPRLDNPTLAALAASDAYMVPVQCEYASMGTIGRVLRAALEIKRVHNTQLAIFGFLITMADKRASFTIKVIHEIREHLKSRVFRTIIPRDPKLAEVPFREEPVIAYDLDTPGSKAYIQLAREILNASSAGRG